MRFYLSSAALILSIAILGSTGSLVAAQERSAVPAKVETAAQDPQIMQLMAEGDKLFGQKEYQKAIEVYQKALDIAKVGDRISDIANLNNKIGNTYYRLEQYAEAIEFYQVSLSNYQKLGDRDAQIAQAWANLGVTYRNLTNHKKSLEAYQNSLSIHKRTGNTINEFYTLRNIARTYHRLENGDTAIEFYLKSLEIARREASKLKEQGDQYAIALTLWELGNRYADKKDYEKSLESYQESLLKYEGSINDEADVHLNIGLVYNATGKNAQALISYEKSLEGYKASNNTIQQAYILRYMARAYSSSAKTDLAIQFYLNSLEKFKRQEADLEKKGHKYAIALTLWELGNRYADKKDYEKSLVSYQESLLKYKGSINDEADVYRDIGLIYNEIGKKEQALLSYEKSLEGYKTSNNVIQQAYVLRYMARAYASSSRTDLAIQFHLNSLEAFKRQAPDLEKKGHKYAIALTLWELGNRYYDMGEYEKSLKFYLDSLIAYQGSLNEEAQVLNNISNVYRQMNQLDKAREYYEKGLKVAQLLVDSNKKTIHHHSPSNTIGFDNPSSLEGTWERSSSTESGNQLDIEHLIIKKLESTYYLLWDKKGKTATGVGLIEDGKLFVGWGEGPSEQYGVVAYKIYPDHSLSGRWANAQGYLGTEKLSRTSSVKNIEGKYNLQGRNYNGFPYVGTVEIKKNGENLYHILWKLNKSETEYRGVAFQSGDHLVVGWGFSGNPGAAIYEFTDERATGKLALFDSKFISNENIVKSTKQSQKSRLIEIIQKNSDAASLFRVGKVVDAIAKYQEALGIATGIKDDKQRCHIAINIASSYFTLERYSKSLELYNESLNICRQVGQDYLIADILNTIGRIYFHQGKYEKSLEIYRKAIQYYEKRGRKTTIVLANIAGVYTKLGKYSEAIDLYNRALKAYQLEGNYLMQGFILEKIGFAYSEQGYFDQALKSLNEGLKSYDKSSPGGSLRGIILKNIGLVHMYKGDYATAFSYYRKSLSSHRDAFNRDQSEQGSSISAEGLVSQKIGQYSTALKAHENALGIYREFGYRASEGEVISLIADVNVAQGNFSAALDLYQQALKIHDEVGNLPGKITTLSGLGTLYNLTNDSNALEVHQQAVELANQVNSLPRIIHSLIQLGQTQLRLNKSRESQISFQQALIISAQIGDRPTEAQAYGNLAALFNKQNQPEIAIVFYKKSVSLYEDIRKGLAPLPKDQQQSYTNTVAQTYRDLADLLLKNDRILEARQVIELLKLQELEEYNKNTRGQSAPLAFLKAETDILNALNQQLKSQYESIKSVQEEIEMLRKKLIDQENPQDRDRKNKLEKYIEDADKQFSAFIDRKDIQEHIQLLQKNDKTVPLNGDDLATLQANLNQLQNSKQNAAILFPVIFNDRIELLLITPNALLRRTVKQSESGKPFDRVQFNQLISTFISKLSNSTKDPKPTAYQLYKHLIEPIEMDLKNANINTIIYGPDRRLRAIPIAALHDGKQWILERYQVSHINAIGTTNFHSERNAPPKVLAGSLSDDIKTEYTVKTPNNPNTHTFKGLPAAKLEARATKKFIPSSTLLEDTNFQFDKIRDLTPDYNIIHFATHGFFQLGQPEESFILFGGPDSKGKNYATLKDIGTWKLSNIDLVILSACQTAVVADQNTDKLGIMGLGDSIQARGAKSAIASLWNVNDASTAILMKFFYTHLSQNKTKSEALRQAQIDLLNIQDQGSKNRAIDDLTRFVNMKIPFSEPPATPKSPIAPGYSHPYYWAPFILIGNGR